ncbi:1,4-alpha-glucan-branching enzyme [Puteibacter caeruleilacunae]|nr:1,4-alpha-glucan-branching enzyme [Puteibacter caeruleilacunae]
MTIQTFAKNDPWLAPFGEQISDRVKYYRRKRQQLLGEQTLSDFASGYLYFGIHQTRSGWVIREWLPNATQLFLVGSFNGWQDDANYQFKALEHDVWELELTAEQLKHGELFALSVHWNGGGGKRVPAWANYVVQDDETKIFNAAVWNPENRYKWKNQKPELDEPLLIYESHVGMAGEEPCVHSYKEFTTQMLPRIKKAGYNVVQLMAIAEHPYYGSFGYHVSSFFAASSRFGTPDELKELIDTAHGMGLKVIMDLVHSHAVKNENEGLGNYDGTRYQFFHDGPKGEHPAWDSYCFNYEKNEVIHFLLSNIKYWLEEYQFDGFRFDGVTSMLYQDHGLGVSFTGYADYFTENTDTEALVYLMLANELIHEVDPHAISIAEDMSGMPGLAVTLDKGGVGFDYRMAMGVPDLWIKLIKEMNDEDWDVGHLFYELTSHREDEKVLSYAESHDQALVGDKTIIFRLLDKEMYYSMRKDQQSLIVDRGIALHKVIRLITMTCAGGAYLNFMGNEFGHPEWIDFPREGNDWSCSHARRIWSIAEDQDLKYHWLKDFDAKMIDFVKQTNMLKNEHVDWIYDHKGDQVLVFSRGNYLMVFNFNPEQSFVDYGIPLEPSKYRLVFSTDETEFGGYDRVDKDVLHYTHPVNGQGDGYQLKLYLPSRTGLIFEKVKFKRIR